MTTNHSLRARKWYFLAVSIVKDSFAFWKWLEYLIFIHLGDESPQIILFSTDIHLDIISLSIFFNVNLRMQQKWLYVSIARYWKTIQTSNCCFVALDFI